MSGVLAKRRYAITVDFDIKREHHDTFMNLVTQNASASVRDEPGCIRFDVMTPSNGGSGRVFLYEIYESEVAFADHLRSAHYLSFDRATAGMIVSKTVGAYLVEENAKDRP
jgi:autoinducer 2-degrading protein